MNSMINEKPALLLAGGRPLNAANMARIISGAFCSVQKPQVAYIGAASGDSIVFFNMMKALLLKAGAGRVTLARLAKDKADIDSSKSILYSSDIIFLSGGEVEDGINWLVKHRLVDFLRELYIGGKQFIGMSAGSIMLGSKWVRWENPDDDNTAELFDCLGFVPEIFDTHAEDEGWKEIKTALRLMGSGAGGYGIPSGGAIYADSSGRIDNIEKEVLTFINVKGEIQMRTRRLRVGVTYNLKRNIVIDPPDAEAEYDDFDTIVSLKSAIESGGYEVMLYEATDDLPEKLAGRAVDIIFNIAEGVNGRGREAQVPAILSYLGIPYTGSDETTMCIAMDKALTKRFLSSYDINIPEYWVISNASQAGSIDLSQPVIVKPNIEGSGKGITSASIVSDISELSKVLYDNIDKYKQDMLVEQYIPGREFTVGILGNAEKMRVFPPMEIIFRDKSNSVYSFAVKRDFKQHVDYKCPPDVSAEILAGMTATAEKIYKALECRDCARIDFRLSPDNKLFFIEINPLPGLAPGYSDFPMLAEFCGIDHTSLILGILNSALERYRKI